MHDAYEHSHTKCGCKGTTYLENGQLFSFFSRFSYNIQSRGTLFSLQHTFTIDSVLYKKYASTFDDQQISQELANSDADEGDNDISAHKSQ